MRANEQYYGYYEYGSNGKADAETSHPKRVEQNS
jgi:hypothetical protein